MILVILAVFDLLTGAPGRQCAVPCSRQSDWSQEHLGVQYGSTPITRCAPASVRSFVQLVWRIVLTMAYTNDCLGFGPLQSYRNRAENPCSIAVTKFTG